MKTDAFISTRYLCPECGEPNSIREPHDKGKCSKCHVDHSLRIITVKYLDKYGFNIPLEVVDFGAVEFICDMCADTNVILHSRGYVQDSTEFKEPVEDWNPEGEKRNVKQWKTQKPCFEGCEPGTRPTVGKCKCGCEYQLNYLIED